MPAAAVVTESEPSATPFSILAVAFLPKANELLVVALA